MACIKWIGDKPVLVQEEYVSDTLMTITFHGISNPSAYKARVVDKTRRKMVMLDTYTDYGGCDELGCTRYVQFRVTELELKQLMEEGYERIEIIAEYLTDEGLKEEIIGTISLDEVPKKWKRATVIQDEFPRDLIELLPVCSEPT